MTAILLSFCGSWWQRPSTSIPVLQRMHFHNHQLYRCVMRGYTRQGHWASRKKWSTLINHAEMAPMCSRSMWFLVHCFFRERGTVVPGVHVLSSFIIHVAWHCVCCRGSSMFQCIPPPVMRFRIMAFHWSMTPWISGDHFELPKGLNVRNCSSIASLVLVLEQLLVRLHQIHISISMWKAC